jgi:hypothetical protein
MKGTLIKFGIAAGVSVLGVFASTAAEAATFIGSYNVYDGPTWTTNPTVYSAREAAALVFGGVFSDYAISTLSNSINNLAWYDGWGDTQYLITPQNEDFKLDSGNPGYNDPFGGPSYSAYVSDHRPEFYPPGTYNYTNYVWKLDAQAVPTPALLPALLGMGAAALRKRKDEAAEPEQDVVKV